MKHKVVSGKHLSWAFRDFMLWNASEWDLCGTCVQNWLRRARNCKYCACLGSCLPETPAKVNTVVLSAVSVTLEVLSCLAELNQI